MKMWKWYHKQTREINHASSKKFARYAKKKKENKQTNKQTKIKKKKQVRNLKIIRNHMQDKAYW